MSAERLWGRPRSRPCVRSSRMGRSFWRCTPRRETDASGDYRLADLAGGRYYVRAHAPAADDDPQTARTGVPTYYPNTLAAADAEAVRVAPPSESRRIDLTLQPVDTAAVSGRIMSGTGAPLLGGAVTLTPHVGGRVVLGATIGSRVEPDGTFVFPDVPPGSFMIQARALDEATPRLQIRDLPHHHERPRRLEHRHDAAGRRPGRRRRRRQGRRGARIVGWPLGTHPHGRSVGGRQ